MADLTAPRWQLVSSSGWLTPWSKAMLGVAALALGVALAGAPLLWAGIGLLAAIVIGLTLIDPLAGLCAALVLGPTKPLTDAYVPQLPLDLGQIALLVTLGAWLLHAVRKRAIRVPTSPFTLPLLAFIGAASLSLLNALSLGSGRERSLAAAHRCGAGRGGPASADRRVAVRAAI